MGHIVGNAEESTVASGESAGLVILFNFGTIAFPDVAVVAAMDLEAGFLDLFVEKLDEHFVVLAHCRALNVSYSANRQAFFLSISSHNVVGMSTVICVLFIEFHDVGFAPGQTSVLALFVANARMGELHLSCKLDRHFGRQIKIVGLR